MVLDVTNALILTNMPSTKYGEERVVMKIAGVILDMLLELDSETYSKHVVFENGNKLIKVVVLRAIYGMVVALLLLYKKCLETRTILDLSSILTIHVSLTG